MALPVTNEVIKHDREGKEIDWLLVPEFRAFKTASDMMGQAMTHARAGLEMPTTQKHEVTGKDNGPVSIHHTGLSDEDRLARVLAIIQQAAATSPRQDPPESIDS